MSFRSIRSKMLLKVEILFFGCLLVMNAAIVYAAENNYAENNVSLREKVASWCAQSAVDAVNPNIFHLNTTFVTDMSYLFANCDRAISKSLTWDVSSVTTMRGMFLNAKNFNPCPNLNEERAYRCSLPKIADDDICTCDVGEPLVWDTNRVRDMAFMFAGALNFNNSPLFNTSSVTSMEGMFQGASEFNHDLNWDVSNVSNMKQMFNRASKMNGKISDWDTRRVRSMQAMFLGAQSFDGTLNSWDTSYVTDMSLMFANAKSFNGGIGEWNVASVTNMWHMFRNAAMFNQKISEWNTENVEIMDKMFHGAHRFNQKLKDWRIPYVKYCDDPNQNCGWYDRNQGSIQQLKNVSATYNATMYDIFTLNDLNMDSHVNQEVPNDDSGFHFHRRAASPDGRTITHDNSVPGLTTISGTGGVQDTLVVTTTENGEWSIAHADKKEDLTIPEDLTPIPEGFCYGTKTEDDGFNGAELISYIKYCDFITDVEKFPRLPFHDTAACSVSYVDTYCTAAWIQSLKQDNRNTTAVAVGVTAGVVMTVLVAAAVLLIVRRKRRYTGDKDSEVANESVEVVELRSNNIFGRGK